MKARHLFPRSLRLVGFALLLAAAHPSALAQVADAAGCVRLVADTISCTAIPAGAAPPNTERAAPAAPPSDAAVIRLQPVTQRSLPAPPQVTFELTDTTQQANFASGSDELTPLATAKLDQVVLSLGGARVRKVLVTAHTDSQRLVRQALQRFGTNQRLSEARAASVVRYLKEALQLPDELFTAQGFGASRPVANNHTLAGRASNRRAEASLWFEVPVAPVIVPPPPPPPPPPEVATAVSSCIGDGADQIAAVRITVDGVALDPREKINEADRQRCVDVALARADVQVRYDPLEQAPFLNVIAIPQRVTVGEPVRFSSYTNYTRYIARAEVRLFEPEQSIQQTPLAVVALSAGGAAEWVPPRIAKSLLRVTTSLEKPHYLTYVLRVYDHDGHFDETRPRRLDLTDVPPEASVDPAKLAKDTERLAYGENTLVLHNIPVHGGAVTVSGSNVPPGDHVFVQGIAVPVDDAQNFVARQILPGGPQQVTVRIINEHGEGLTFTRNLSVATDDSFFVGLADLTAGSGSVSGPIELVTGDADLAHRNYVNGQLAFYYKGLVKGDWLLTAAADTQDQPLHELFSNFAGKDPQDLLRRIDPTRYYPVYGDDSTTVQDAPTSGKFYLRLDKGDSSVMWGDFQTQLTGTEFIQYARTLYGLNIRYRSQEATTFGEKQRTVDAFWAEPGTLESRQDFRGTGGSLYYLQNQDISVGSEQVSVQVRDQNSGLVLSVTQLVPAQDYDINYLEGRILLHSPLPATADTATFVHTGGLDGDPVYLVVTYEYVPDLSNPSSLAFGGHASEWFGDHLQLGLSSFHQADPGEQQDLLGINGTWRYKPGTYLKAEYAYSDGTGSPNLTSITGGLNFNALTTDGSAAGAERVEAAVDLSEVTDSMKGRVSTYYEQRDAEFSGPGQITPGVSVRQGGGALNVPLDSATQLVGKFDSTDSATATANTGEVAIEHKLDDNWRVAVGGRLDERENAVPNESAILSQNGTRADVAVTIGYQPKPAATTQVSASPAAQATAVAPAQPGALPVFQLGGLPAAPSGAAAPAQTAATPFLPLPGAQPAPADASPASQTPGSPPPPELAATAPGAVLGPSRSAWDSYAFVQGTAYRTDTRSENDRAGVGGSYQVTDAMRLGAEASDGSLGFGAKASTDYRIDDRSNVYVTYALAADQPDALDVGREGTLTSGVRYRYDDATSVYGEERLQTGTGPLSLTHAYGVDFAPSKQWTYGLKLEHGTISDPLAGDMELTSVAGTLAYTNGQIKYSGALEWRQDDSSLTGASHTQLTRNSLTYQIDPDWRLLGNINWSQTDGISTAALNADYHEIVIGAAWRPVKNDRWNMLFKFTILDDQPPSVQLSSSGTPVDFAQQSRVTDIDTMYQTTSWLSLGGKYAIRTGELKQTLPAEGEWYASQAQLGIVRADVLFGKSWDGVLELRCLNIHETDDQRTGILLGWYRHVNDHLKIGVGYNFTNYSDNLTDLSYRRQGLFINMSGKF